MMFYLLPASPDSQKCKLKFLSQAIYDPPLRKINRNPEQALWMAKTSGVIWGLILFSWVTAHLVIFPLAQKCYFEKFPIPSMA